AGRHALAAGALALATLLSRRQRQGSVDAIDRSRDHSRDGRHLEIVGRTIAGSRNLPGVTVMRRVIIALSLTVLACHGTGSSSTAGDDGVPVDPEQGSATSS